MILWFTVGFFVWLSCVLLMLAIIKGGHRVRASEYEQKLNYISMINTKNRKKESKKKGEEKTNKDRRITDRRITDRRITEGIITDRRIMEGVLVIKRLKQRRCGQRRNMEGLGWQERPSMN